MAQRIGGAVMIIIKNLAINPQYITHVQIEQRFVVIYFADGTKTSMFCSEQTEESLFKEIVKSITKEIKRKKQ